MRVKINRIFWLTLAFCLALVIVVYQYGLDIKVERAITATAASPATTPDAALERAVNAGARRSKANGETVESEIFIEKNGTINITFKYTFDFLTPRPGLRVPLFPTNLESYFQGQSSPAPTDTPSEAAVGQEAGAVIAVSPSAVSGGTVNSNAVTSGAEFPRLIYKILEARIDNIPSSFELRPKDDGLQILQIGSPAIDLPPGRHEFYLRYTVENAVRFDPEEDIVILNLGGDWSVPIPTVNSIIHFPKLMEAATILLTASYGSSFPAASNSTTPAAKSAANSGYDFSIPAPPQKVAINLTDQGYYATATIASLQPLAPLQHLAVKIRLPKGFIRQATP